MRWADTPRGKAHRLAYRRYVRDQGAMFPTAPLCAFLAAAAPDEESKQRLSARAGVAAKTIERILAAEPDTRRITRDCADRLALALGLHPVLIWGDDWVCEESA